MDMMDVRTFEMLSAVIVDEFSNKFLRVRVIDYLSTGLFPYYSDDVLYLGSDAPRSLENANQLPLVISYGEFSQRPGATSDDDHDVRASYIDHLSAHESASGEYKDIVVPNG